MAIFSPNVLLRKKMSLEMPHEICFYDQIS